MAKANLDQATRTSHLWLKIPLGIALIVSLTVNMGNLAYPFCSDELTETYRIFEPAYAFDEPTFIPNEQFYPYMDSAYTKTGNKRRHASESIVTLTTIISFSRTIALALLGPLRRLWLCSTMHGLKAF